METTNTSAEMKLPYAQGVEYIDANANKFGEHKPIIRLCVAHIEQYYCDVLHRNAFRLAWQLQKGVIVRVDHITQPCDWCKVGMPTF